MTVGLPPESWAAFSSSATASTRGDVLQRDRRNHQHASRHRDVELIACAGPPSSSSDRSYEWRYGAKSFLYACHRHAPGHGEVELIACAVGFVKPSRYILPLRRATQLHTAV